MAICMAPSLVLLPPINPVAWQKMQFLIPATDDNWSSRTPRQSLCRNRLWKYIWVLKTVQFSQKQHLPANKTVRLDWNPLHSPRIGAIVKDAELYLPGNTQFFFDRVQMLLPRTAFFQYNDLARLINLLSRFNWFFQNISCWPPNWERLRNGFLLFSYRIYAKKRTDKTVSLNSCPTRSIAFVNSLSGDSVFDEFHSGFSLCTRALKCVFIRYRGWPDPYIGTPLSIASISSTKTS